MNKTIRCLLVFGLVSATIQAQGIKNTTMNDFNEKGVLAPSSNFSGTVWVNMNVTKEDGYNTMIGTVLFEPKARTNWHSHTSGQLLFVVSGRGYYQEKGKEIQLIQEGSVVKIPKNVAHWHGASHTGALKHIAIIPELDQDKTTWLNAVSDVEYGKALSDLSDSSDSKIKLTESAIRHHEELWPDYVLKAQKTDPELIEVFDNFAFDEVIHHNRLDVKTRVMVILASNLSSQALTEYKMFVNAGLNVGISPVEIKEIVYQAVPYVGIAKVIDFLAATNDIFAERGISLPLEPQSTTSAEDRMEKGLALQKAIFGERIDQMYKNAPENQLHIQEYLSANCFGDYLTRKGLDVKTRELLTYSMLISMGGAESQVKGHIRGNVSVGNDKQKLIDVTTQLLPYIGYPRTLNALQCLNEILPENL